MEHQFFALFLIEALLSSNTELIDDKIHMIFVVNLPRMCVFLSLFICSKWNNDTWMARNHFKEIDQVCLLIWQH